PRTHRVPRLARGRNEILSGRHRRKLEIAQIVGGVPADDERAVEARNRHSPIENDACLANRFPSFIKHFPTEEGERRQLEPEMLGVESRTGDDGRPELLMLFVSGSNEAALGALQ